MVEDNETIDLGNNYIIEKISAREQKFGAGDRTVLFEVISICARYQAVIPEWVVDEILKIDSEIVSGEMIDFNHAFGFANQNLAKRKKAARDKKNTIAVLSMLQQLRAQGQTLNADDICQTVADNLGISRRGVEDIYKQDGKFIKDIKKGDNCGFAIIEIKEARRHGRPMFQDK